MVLLFTYVEIDYLLNVKNLCTWNIFFPAVLVGLMKDTLFFHIRHFSLWSYLSSFVSWEVPRENNLS